MVCVCYYELELVRMCKFSVLIVLCILLICVQMMSNFGFLCMVLEGMKNIRLEDLKFVVQQMRNIFFDEIVNMSLRVVSVILEELVVM